MTKKSQKQQQKQKQAQKKHNYVNQQPAIQQSSCSLQANEVQDLQASGDNAINNQAPHFANFGETLEYARQIVTLAMSLFFKLILAKAMWVIAGGISFYIFCCTLTSVISYVPQIQEGVIWAATIPTHIETHKQHLRTDLAMKQLELERMRNESAAQSHFLADVNDTLYAMKREMDDAQKFRDDFALFMQRFENTARDVKLLAQAQHVDQQTIERLIGQIGDTQQAIIGLKTNAEQTQYISQNGITKQEIETS